MIKYLALGIVSVTLCISACSDSNGSTDSQASSHSGSSALSPSPTPIYTNASQGSQSGIFNQQTQVIVDSEQFSSLLSSVSLSGTIPNVDFSSSELVGVFINNTSTCGMDSLSVGSINETPTTVTLHISRQQPTQDPNIACTMQFRGHPYILVEIQKTTKPISVVYE